MAILTQNCVQKFIIYIPITLIFRKIAKNYDHNNETRIWTLYISEIPTSTTLHTEMFYFIKMYV
jgi:hypothetical protein